MKIDPSPYFTFFVNCHKKEHMGRNANSWFREILTPLSFSSSDSLVWFLVCVKAHITSQLLCTASSFFLFLLEIKGCSLRFFLDPSCVMNFGYFTVSWRYWRRFLISVSLSCGSAMIEQQTRMGDMCGFFSRLADQQICIFLVVGYWVQWDQL